MKFQDVLKFLCDSYKQCLLNCAEKRLNIEFAVTRKLSESKHFHASDSHDGISKTEICFVHEIQKIGILDIVQK